MPDALAKLEMPPAEGPGRTPGEARRFAAAALAVVLLGLATCSAAAVAVDPRGEFPGERYRPLVLDVPSAKLRLYEEAAPADALVLGSSRGMPLPPDALPEERGFNFALLGGSLRDDRLAYDAAVRIGGPPQRLVIALDSFQLMRPPEAGEWSVVLDSASAPRYLGEPVPWTESLRALPSTLSASYARDVAKVLWYTHASGYPEGANAFRDDGLGLRPSVDAEIAAGTYDLDQAFERNWERYLGQIYLPGAEELPGAAQGLADLVETARGDGAEVDVVLMPFWHGALERFEGNAEFARFQERAREVAVASCGPGVHVFDYTEVHAFGGLPDGFYDGYHVTPENGALLLEAVAARRGDLCP